MVSPRRTATETPPQRCLRLPDVRAGGALTVTVWRLPLLRRRHSHAVQRCESAAPSGPLGR
jgi:hypothetical protein